MPAEALYTNVVRPVPQHLLETAVGTFLSSMQQRRLVRLLLRHRDATEHSGLADEKLGGLCFIECKYQTSVGFSLSFRIFKRLN